ncbi:Protein phosphatase PP2A regulatory subunit A [Gossypium arboreum]|uniref:Protein phosphatase PP2A regulatory subunit A n=1 Tax=Gossypium arboreum TaxID=29729 RepID=A0A0B0Q0U4_GOSAR|nr:Protein phosphatase PP2A regulatory subunit A [Gossypium arboreum]
MSAIHINPRYLSLQSQVNFLQSLSKISAVSKCYPAEFSNILSLEIIFNLIFTSESPIHFFQWELYLTPCAIADGYTFQFGFIFPFLSASISCFE